VRERQASDADEPVFMGRFGMFDVHFLLLFSGAGPTREYRLHEQRMETAKARRQLQVTDNRTLILLSIFHFYQKRIHKNLFLKVLFVVFGSFYDAILFLVIFVILITSGH
jgi:hypothetical protein